MGTLRNSGTGTDGGTAQRHLWLTADQACEALGIRPRALRKRVTTGTVERRKVGRKSLYRLCTAAPAKEEPGTGTEATEAPRGHLVAIGGTTAALAPVPQSDPAPAPVELARLVEQLTADLAAAERERGEAIGIGFMLADERDQSAEQAEDLQRRLAWLQRAMFHLADSPLSFPVRSRLLSILRRSVH